MSDEVSLTQKLEHSSPSSIRYFVLSVTTCMSVLLYLDRFSVGIASEYIRKDMQMSQTEMAVFISAFFWSYALCQVPAGWLSDRLGARLMLTTYIIAWSIFTGLIGAAQSVAFLIFLRVGCGIAQAGAYPTAVGLVRHWFPISKRGMASSFVALGGRLGGVLAPILTAWLIVCFATSYPAEVDRPQDPGWRQTIGLYGFVGIIVSVLFAVIVRNRPSQHPMCNDDEQNLIHDEHSKTSAANEPRDPSFPWKAFFTNVSMWGNSMTQFLTNFGWFFITTSLPRYLETVHEVPTVKSGLMTACPMIAGVIGMLAGGRITDWGFRNFGLKWGRRIPLVASRVTAASGYGICLALGVYTEPNVNNVWLPWLFIGGLCIASASADLGTPSIWAFCQDVGGKYTASILGWGNMWGNFGAATAPLIYNYFLGEKPSLNDWNIVFAICCGSFVLAAFCAMVLDATKPLTFERDIGLPKVL